ncbi:MAG: hypothetical protein ACK4RK_14900 [Gemmataceae bacterium]
MMRRYILIASATVAMIAVAAVRFADPNDKLLVLEWAAQGNEPKPAAAVLIEFGLRDVRPTAWSNRATITGAKVVHREGYQFRPTDQLVEPNGWQITSHRPLRLPKASPQLMALEKIATVGVVLHLADVRPDAKLTLDGREAGDQPVEVNLAAVLAGQPQPIFDGAGVVRLVTTATPIVATQNEDDFPAAAYGPDGTLWVAYISYHNRDEDRRIESAQLREQPKNFQDYYQPDFADQLFVKYYQDGKWSEPIAITGAKEDLVRCGIAVAGNGTAWVAYSAQRDGNFDIYSRSIRAAGAAPQLGPEQRVTNLAGPALGPVMSTNQSGNVILACQYWEPAAERSPGAAVIQIHVLKDGQWQSLDAPASGTNATNRWHPALATDARGGFALAHDAYIEGDYDVLLSLHDGTRWNQYSAASSSFYEARPSLCYDLKGRLWIAYEQGPKKWGKDFGALDDEDGNPLYFARTVKVVCLDGDKPMRPVAELPPLQERIGSPETGRTVEAYARYAYPQIGIDGRGDVWVTYRVKHGTRYSTHPGSYWLTVARRLEGNKWSEPIEVHHSDGLLDDRPVLLPHPAGGLRLIHNTDGRYTTPETIKNDIYMSYVELPGKADEPKLVAHTPGQKDPATVAAARKEAADVARMRGYRIDAGGRKLCLLRGEFHRHTEISWDGGPDGSLEDMFRYGIDAAAMDWIGNGDHDNGAGREYPWWLTQKLTDAYHVKGLFTPMFTYERSCAYPHGHRNCMFAQRGVLTLPRLAAGGTEPVAGIHADDAKMLYRYLHEHNGICAMHTSATGMGTDWRDNDPVVEPIVEIYQGDRMSYEKEGAPRAGYDPKTGMKPANIAGWYPLGFVNLALAKGYRLGFQASSDHFSTHISYCVILAERPERQAMLDAVKRRHVYGATDNIIIDVRSGAHIQGDEFKTSAPPKLDIHIIGTAPLDQVVILRDSETVQTIRPEGNVYQGTWTDPNPKAEAYYYVRVLQKDDELGWSSPMWIHYVK